MQPMVGKVVKVDDTEFVTNIDQFLVHSMYAWACTNPDQLS